jgi:hypothetical protein
VVVMLARGGDIYLFYFYRYLVFFFFLEIIGFFKYSDMWDPVLINKIMPCSYHLSTDKWVLYV